MHCNSFNLGKCVGELRIDKASSGFEIKWYDCKNKPVTGYFLSPCDEIVSVCSAHCCSRVPLTISEAERFGDKAVIKDGKYYMKEKEVQGLSKCFFQDENDKCKIYSERPLICRTHPFNINEVIDEGDEILFKILLRHCETRADPVNEKSPLDKILKAEELNNNLARLGQEKHYKLIRTK